MSEDCLFLNVFVPTTIKTNDTAAVMVWIHGGAFSWGTSTFYPSDILAAFNDVIVVTINYRLGVLGFFNVPGTDVKGNYGMLDQVNYRLYFYCDHSSFFFPLVLSGTKSNFTTTLWKYLPNLI